MTRRLFLLRHAKAEADDGSGDHERPLSGRGRRDAPAMGREITRRGYRPELILCSTSRRTAETLDLAMPFLTPPPPTRLEPSLYHAEARQILSRAAAVEASFASVMFVGHNPGLEELALQLAGDGKVARRIAEKFPTCSFAAFESTAASWQDAAKGPWNVIAFLRPAEL